MGLFDSFQKIIGGASDLAQGAIGDVVGGVTDNPIVQDLQEKTTTFTESATDVVGSVTEQGHTAVEDITNNLGL